MCRFGQAARVAAFLLFSVSLFLRLPPAAAWAGGVT